MSHSTPLKILRIAPADDPAVPADCPSCALAEGARSVQRHYDEVAPRMPHPQTLRRYNEFMRDFFSHQLGI